MASFWKPEDFGQTVLPDMSLLIGQKIGGKCQHTKTWNATFLVIFKYCGVRKCVEPTKESAFATNRKFQHPKNKLSDTFYSTFVI